MKVGPGIDPTTEMGPLVAKEQLDRVWGYRRVRATPRAPGR